MPAGGPYLLQAVKDGVKLQQVTPQVEVGIEYDLDPSGTRTCPLSIPSVTGGLRKQLVKSKTPKMSRERKIRFLFFNIFYLLE